MRNHILKIICVLLLLIQVNWALAISHVVSPLDYGFDKAKNDIERYHILYKTHIDAFENNWGVTYRGIKVINLEIPNDASSIPLSSYTDFAGVTINVKNTTKDLWLYALEQAPKSILLTKDQFSNLKFSQIDQLNKGVCLLIIEDGTPWVEIRKGYDYGAIRRDIVLISDGIPKNKPIQKYSNEYSKPLFSYCSVSKDPKVIQNLIFNRTKSSTHKTFLFKIICQNNVYLKKIELNTPETEGMYGDNAICIQNCTNIQLIDIVINGTYSQSNLYGYGINLNNVWASQFIRLKAKANWGVFGNYNVNFCKLNKCDINRFDVHCYGRDIYFKNTTFRGLYNQFSSIYGEISFENCRFIDFVPVLFESSFSAYTPFKLIIKNCSLKVDVMRPYLIDAGIIERANHKVRIELDQFFLPSIRINGLQLEIPESCNKWELYKIDARIPDLKNTKDVSAKRIKYKGKGANAARNSF